MSTPLQLPVRVLVKGASNVLMTSWMGGPRTDMPFPRVVEAELLAGGRAAEVRNAGELGMPIRRMYKTWEVDVARWSPDVILFAVGQYDVLHALLPYWLERMANRVDRRPSFTQRWWRKAVRLLVRGVLKTQRFVDRPSLLLKRRTRHALRDLAGYIKLSSNWGSPLIILLEIHPPTTAKMAWFGGWHNRIAAFNQGMRDIAANETSGNVLFVEMTDLTEQFDPGTPDELWADGIHFNPAMHRLVGQRLAGVIDDWAADQPHLARP